MWRVLLEEKRTCEIYGVIRKSNKGQVRMFRNAELNF